MATAATVLLVAGIVASLASAAVGAYAAYEQGQQAKKIGKFNAKVAENAALARRQAAAIEADNKRKQFAAIMAASRAGAGASGALTSEGSPLLVEISDAENAKLNEARIRYSGEVGARAQESEALVQRFVGRRAAQTGAVRAGASLLSGVASAAGQYAQYASHQGRTTLRDDV
jgi:hypothetical protein